jgi:hypothetical protein
MNESISKAIKMVNKAANQTVMDPYRNRYPGIYGNPKEIAAEAASRVAPEDVAMKRLFGVTRDELHEMSEGRKGNVEPNIATSKNARGSLSALNTMNPMNAQRLIDNLVEAGNHPGLKKGMDAWYTMDPVYKRIKELVGEDDAPEHYRNLNTIIGMMSPGSRVETEINRGLAAHYLQQHQRINDFHNFGGIAKKNRGPDFPPDLKPMMSHAYHKTSQSGPLKKYLENGRIISDNPKVPLYVQASGVPETGFQTKGPVPDAHFTRAVGMADTRKGPTDIGASMGRAEHQSFAPWFREHVADKVGLEAVPAQARLWGSMSGQTGVKTMIGAPKMEMLAKHIMSVARRHQIPPEVARDLVLTGGIYYRGGAVEKALSKA